MAQKGGIYDVVESGSDGWVRVTAGDKEGYLKTDGITLEEADEAAEAAQQAQETQTSKRQQVVDYALQFVGGRYKYGGSDPHTGVDCSGFTRYVMQNGAGVSLNRSSGSQAAQGVSISAAQMQPGDLIFYGNGKRINHVALYIGNGQIVHAVSYTHLDVYKRQVLPFVISIPIIRSIMRITAGTIRTGPMTTEAGTAERRALLMMRELSGCGSS